MTDPFSPRPPEVAGNAARRGNLHLSVALSDNPRTRPVRDGRVSVGGADFVVTTLHPSEMFWRQLHFAEFDVSEMSLSSLLIAIAGGDRRWVALPVFTSRKFYHTLILIRTDRGIETPQDLKGKRVAVPEYQQTAAVWSRGALQHEFGVHPSEVQWYMERTSDRSHGGATGFEPPTGVTIHQIPEDQDIGSMLATGTVDASLLYLNVPNLVDRSRADLGDRPDIRKLFDPVVEGARYYRETDFLPMNHCVVLKREVVEANPWIALNVFKAFEQAKVLARWKGEEFIRDYFDVGLLPMEQRAVVDRDLFPYGVRANRKALDTLTAYSFEQGLTPRRITVEEIFHPPTLDL